MSDEPVERCFMCGHWSHPNMAKMVTHVDSCMGVEGVCCHHWNYQYANSHACTAAVENTSGELHILTEAEHVRAAQNRRLGGIRVSYYIEEKQQKDSGPDPLEVKEYMERIVTSLEDLSRLQSETLGLAQVLQGLLRDFGRKPWV